MQDNNVINFNQAKLIAGPKDPPTGPNWLSQLDVGTMFLTRPKNSKSFELVTCEILGKTPSGKAVRLKNTGMEEANDGRGPVKVKLQVDSAIFSAMMELVEIIGIVDAEPDNKEQEYGNSDRDGESAGIPDARSPQEFA